MKKLSYFRMSLALLLVGAPLGALADTFFTDDFSNGSTLDGVSAPGGATNASFTSYDLASSKNATVSTIGPNLLSGKLSSATTSGYWEAQALFTTNPVVMVAPGDYIDMTIVFTNSAGALLTGSTKSAIWVGLYNSGAAPGTTNPPVAGALANGGLNKNSGSPYATGNCQLWAGYAGQIFSGTGSRIITRPIQDGTGTTSANQELLGDGASGGTFNNPAGSSLATSSSQTITLANSNPYTVELQIMLDPAGSGNLIISNALYNGVGTGGSIIMSNAVMNAPLTSGFDGLALGAFNSSSVSANPQMDVSSISITGHTTVITTPPTITNQPVSVTAPAGAFVPFIVGATGFNMTYQWHRYGTNLVNGGNISGANSPTLIISPVTAADAASGANSYYVTITGAGGYSTNSTMASLSLGTATSLTWSGNSSSWDLNSTADWLNPSSSLTTFNYGDLVTFNDTGLGNAIVSLNNQYLSAASVTVNSSSGYTFTGSGSFAGPGSLNYLGAGGLEIDNANTYTGGTVISNASAYLYLNNLNGLGTGPITLAQAGGSMEVVPTGGAAYGLNGDVAVADNFTIYFDGDGSYAGVLFGNLSGAANKTLTLAPNPLVNPATTNRYRVYGSSTVYNGNLALDPNDPPVANANYTGTTLAPYNASGSQTYNGVISGSGGIVQRSGGSTILNGPNTYSGGTTPTTGSIGLGIDSTGNPVTAGPIGTGPLYLAPELPNTSGSGTLFASGGAHTIANPIQYPSATNNLTLIIGGTNDLTLAGPFSLNGNDGLGTQTNRTIEVTDTGLATISGLISGSGFNLTKTGSGVLALNNAETYTGATTVNGGTLLVNGSLGAGSVTVTSGRLGGSGTIAGPVTAQTGGLAPGNLGVGTLTINNTLTLQSGSSNIFEVNQTVGTHDQVNATSVSYGGTLYATNLSGTLAPGDSFTIFSTGSETGNFTTVAGSPGAGLAWSFNPVNGVLSVVSGVATNPTNIMVSVSSGNLNLSWPADHLGWTLQTNSVGLAATNMWFAYPGSASVTNVTIPIDTTRTNVFYRLTYTP
ncbi:MAG TPA: autotransporter-associated beta strand repeat-containing protein [Verrucomicrobiae bacterium]|nr:autotransporter-associated beta strand repeat-containing protein [Verrucomicrobiae bacterium]